MKAVEIDYDQRREFQGALDFYVKPLEGTEMSHTPHELAEEFPELAEKIHALKVSDTHFARLAEEYHTINRDIHRAEENVEPTDELNEQAMRKQRMALKDQLYALLTA